MVLHQPASGPLPANLWRRPLGRYHTTCDCSPHPEWWRWWSHSFPLFPPLASSQFLLYLWEDNADGVIEPVATLVGERKSSWWQSWCDLRWCSSLSIYWSSRRKSRLSQEWYKAEWRISSVTGWLRSCSLRAGTRREVHIIVGSSGIDIKLIQVQVYHASDSSRKQCVPACHWQFLVQLLHHS